MADTFLSHAQNGEDVVLWRALGQIEQGSYIDVGANDPDVDSISRAFYDSGWRGVLVEPVPEFAAKLRARRPGDVVVEAAIVDDRTSTATLHSIVGTGLSTLDDEIGERHEQSGWSVQDIEVSTERLDAVLERVEWGDRPIHFMTVDVEGAERQVLSSIDLRRWRPWVLVVEATLPLTTTRSHGSWEAVVLDAGYEFCLFDGLSRFYVAEEHAESLAPQLSYPACTLDDYVTAQEQEAQARVDELRRENQRRGDLLEETTAELVRWRGRVLERWAEACAVTHPRPETAPAEAALRREIEAMQSTLSWRVTKPLRVARRAMGPRP